MNKLILDLEEDSAGLDVIFGNLKNLDYVLNKIVYLKSHAVYMMFKDAIVLKKEKQLDEDTVVKGMHKMKGLIQNALVKIITEGALDNVDAKKLKRQVIRRQSLSRKNGVSKVNTGVDAEREENFTK